MPDLCFLSVPQTAKHIAQVVDQILELIGNSLQEASRRRDDVLDVKLLGAQFGLFVRFFIALPPYAPKQLFAAKP